MTYEPNLRDPRVVTRIRNALGFAKGVLSETKPHQWSTRFIDKHLGQQQHPLGAWLRAQLLITTDDHWNKETGACKQYMLNASGYLYLKSLISGESSYTTSPEQIKLAVLNELIEPELEHEPLKSGYVSDGCFTDESHWTNYKLNESGSDFLRNLKPKDIKNNYHRPYPIVSQVRNEQLIKQWATTHFEKELKSRVFVYKDKSDRLWHPLQGVKKEYKKVLFNEFDLNYQYDIQCCAPSLIHQYAQTCGMDLYLFGIREYLKDRQAIRSRIAKETDITTQQAKIVINALFSGAQLGLNKESALYQEIKDEAKIEFLKQDDFIIKLRADIKTCWEYIAPNLTRVIITTKTGKSRTQPITPKQKWGVYFRLERQVLDSIKEFMDKEQINYFLEHDGWASSEQLNELELIQWVKDKTGYSIKLEMNSLKQHLPQPIPYCIGSPE